MWNLVSAIAGTKLKDLPEICYHLEFQLQIATTGKTWLTELPLRAHRASRARTTTRIASYELRVTATTAQSEPLYPSHSLHSHHVHRTSRGTLRVLLVGQ